MGWLTGIEPATVRLPSRGSTIELQPPLIRMASEFSPRRWLTGRLVNHSITKAVYYYTDYPTSYKKNLQKPFPTLGLDWFCIL